MNDAIPTDYSSPGYPGIKPGPAWFIRGRRYTETAREQMERTLGYFVIRAEES